MTAAATNETSAQIAALNDAFRRSGTVSVSQGVFNLPDLPGLIRAVREYGDFSTDNDPYGEHDFGSLSWEGETIFWKIDYYDRELRYWCDPLSPACQRILTVILAGEY